MEKKDEVTEIEFMHVMRLLFRKIWIIILAAVLAGGVFCCVSIFGIQPKYTAETMLYVNNKSLSVGDTKVSISQGDLTAAQSLIETYGVILKSRNTLNEVIKQSGVDYTYKELVKMIDSEAINATEVFHVKVTSPSASEAELLANTIARVLPEKIASIVDGSSVRIVDYAVIPSQKSSPNITLNTLLGILIGGFIAAAVIVMRELQDDQIHSTDFITQNCEQPILAVVPDLKQKSSGHYGYGYGYGSGGKKGKKRKKAEESGHKHKNPQGKVVYQNDEDILGENLNFAAAETYKLLRTNLEFSAPDEDSCQIIGFTSAMRGEGKTTTAINTAYTFAETGKRVLLIEADMRLPNIARRLGIKQSPGLSNLLPRRRTIPVQGTLQRSGLIDSMWVITGGDTPPNPAELLGSKSMKESLNKLATLFDVILVDLPPVGVVSDALTVSKYLDGLVIVVRQNMCTQKGLSEVLRKMKVVNSKILGYVVTGSDAAKKSGHYKKYGYSSSYENEYDDSYESVHK